MVAYTDYKPATLPDLGVIPSQWGERRMKTAFAESDVRSTTGDEEMLSVSHITGVTPRSQKNVNMFLSESNIGQKICSPGDIVINTMWAWMAALGVSNYNGIVSPSYGVYRPKGQDYNPAYLDYLLRTEVYRAEYVRRSTGINLSRLRLYPDRFLSMHFVCPPRPEQDQIVRYLNWKVSQINRLINSKRRQIELLQEQKQAIINAAVMKGGEGWCEHQLAKIATITLSGLDKKSYEGQTPVLLCNYVDVYKNDIITSALDFMKATASEAEKASLKLHLDDVVITKDSESWDDIGVPVYVAEEIDNLYCGYHLAIIRTNKEVLYGEYLAFTFQSQYIQIQHKVKAKGVTRFALGYQPIHDTIVLVPPLDEQFAIVQEIKIRCQTQDSCITNIKEQIVLLAEFRARLISDVVTGKLDVRGVVVPDYEAVEETAEGEPTGEEDIGEGDDE